jgi:hypothetical protein
MSTQLESVLAPLVNALEADGYGAVIEESPGHVSFQIVAGPDACEECLSPPQIMTGIIESVLRQNGYQVELQLKYPVDPATHHA